MVSIGVVTGMASEAKLLRGLDLMTISTGGNPEATKRGIEAMIRDGADRLVSFGIAGALDPEMKPGDLVLASAVHLADGHRQPTDQKWLVHIAQHLPQARIADVAASSGIVATAEAKATLHRDSGAVCVDQESHWVAAMAEANRMPFIVVRAIADRAGDSLPRAVLVGLDAQGRPRTGAVIAALLRDPGQILGLTRVALQTRKALKALFRSRAALTV
ncbi:MAG TPA: nucleoside phosphorylase [Dongiaceae bacterium]|jgi:hopanoid-associated phosphorylase|nr:nucleoside phosphorylase [Dongiaceae bacterium]